MLPPGGEICYSNYIVKIINKLVIVLKKISDWRFPFKKSSHPVCVHYGRNKVIVKLPKCEKGVLPGTELYEYMEAADCKCQQCSSSDTSCEGLRYRPHRSHPDSLGFLIN